MRAAQLWQLTASVAVTAGNFFLLLQKRVHQDLGWPHAEKLSQVAMYIPHCFEALANSFEA